MRAITAVSTITPTSKLLVGCTGYLSAPPCCLRPYVCTHVLYRVCVLGRISDILRRFSLGCQSCLVVCIFLWQSDMSGYLSRRDKIFIVHENTWTKSNLLVLTQGPFCLLMVIGKITPKI